MNLIVLDGATGHLLKSNKAVSMMLGYDAGFLPGTLANVELPSVVTELHCEYLRAGANVITTNNFLATQYSLGKIGMQEKQEEIIKAAAKCAKEAVSTVQNDALIAGSVPPLTVCYQEPLLSNEELDVEYERIVKCLKPDVDLLLCETLSSLREAQSAARICSMTQLPYWISFTLLDSLQKECKLRNGESLSQSVASILQFPRKPQAMLVNCCAPQTITLALKSLTEQFHESGIQFGAYGNGFETTTSEWMSISNDSFKVTAEEEYDKDGVILPEAYLIHVKNWVDLGASIIGGCCATTPSHIQNISQFFKPRC